MKFSLKYLMCFCTIIFFTGCKYQLSEEELIKYINDPENGLVQIKEVNQVKYEIIYKPASLLLHKDNSINNDSMLKRKKEEYEKYQYFVLSLSAAGEDVLYGGSGGFQNFSENLQKFSFALNQYVQMQTSAGDALYLADYYMPNLYGMAKSTQILLAFEKPKKETEELEIIIEELGLGTGRQKFIFRRDDIEAVPELIQNQ